MQSYTRNLLNRVDQELELICQQNTSEKIAINLSIKLLENEIIAFQQWQYNYDVENSGKEIAPFIDIKPTLNSKLQYFNTLSKWCENAPLRDEDRIIYYAIKRDQIYRTIKKHKNFHKSGAESNHTNQLISKNENSHNHSTLKNEFWDKLLCYNMLLEYIDKTKMTKNENSNLASQKLKWQGTKNDFITLSYSLYHSKEMYDGNMSYEYFVKKLEGFIEIDVSKSAYKKVSYLKNKNEMDTTYIDGLKNTFIKKMSEK